MIVLALFAVIVLFISLSQREPMTDIPMTGRTLPQVDALGRSFDEKVASDQNTEASYAPDLNALFESLNKDS